MSLKSLNHSRAAQCIIAQQSLPPPCPADPALSLHWCTAAACLGADDYRHNALPSPVFPNEALAGMAVCMLDQSLLANEAARCAQGGRAQTHKWVQKQAAVQAELEHSACSPCQASPALSAFLRFGRPGSPRASRSLFDPPGCLPPASVREFPSLECGLLQSSHCFRMR